MALLEEVLKDEMPRTVVVIVVVSPNSPPLSIDDSTKVIYIMERIRSAVPDAKITNECAVKVKTSETIGTANYKLSFLNSKIKLPKLLKTAEFVLVYGLGGEEEILVLKNKDGAVEFKEKGSVAFTLE